MTEALFILTTVYVAYVIYKLVDNQKEEMQANRSKNETAILTPSGLVPAAETAATSATEESPAANVTASPVAEPAPAAAVKTAEKNAMPTSSNELRHPETGETAKVSNNYRSLKRWLKEALVTEGLLGKVYPNNELNDETNAKIKKALEIIKTMPKYHA